MDRGLIKPGYRKMFDSRKIASMSYAPDHLGSLREAATSGFTAVSFSAATPRMSFLHVPSPPSPPCDHT